MATIEQITTEMAKLLKPLQEQVQTISDKMEKVQETMNTIRIENSDLKKKNEQLETEITELKSTIETLNIKLIKKNIVIFGLQEVENENLPETVSRLITNDLQIPDFKSSEISDVARIGKQIGEKPRNILVELTTKIRKNMILKNAHKLKGSDIFIQHEFTKQTLEERKALKPYLLETKKNGKVAKLRNNRLIIEGKTYKVSDIQEEGDEENEEEKWEDCDPTQNTNNKNTNNTASSSHNTTTKRKASSPPQNNVSHKIIYKKTKNSKNGQNNKLTQYLRTNSVQIP